MKLSKDHQGPASPGRRGGAVGEEVDVAQRRSPRHDHVGQGQPSERMRASQPIMFGTLKAGSAL
eukprot:2321745-Lingulodinium_polyedra.AAC.1